MHIPIFVTRPQKYFCWQLKSGCDLILHWCYVCGVKFKTIALMDDTQENQINVSMNVDLTHQVT